MTIQTRMHAGARAGLVFGIYKRVVESLEVIKSKLVTFPSLWVLHLERGSAQRCSSKTDIFVAFSQNGTRRGAPRYLTGTAEKQVPALYR